jgi:hypothetical protein
LERSFGRDWGEWQSGSMMKRIVALLMTAIAAVACAPRQPVPVPGANGKTSYAVECLGAEQNCYPKAKKLCPKGYVVTDTKYRAIMNWQGFDVENTLKYTLTVECKDADAK